jgi:hypothetical protein
MIRRAGPCNYRKQRKQSMQRISEIGGIIDNRSDSEWKMEDYYVRMIEGMPSMAVRIAFALRMIFF